MRFDLSATQIAMRCGWQIIENHLNPLRAAMRSLEPISCSMNTLLQKSIAEQFTVTSQTQGMNGPLFRLWFPESPNLVYDFDDIRKLANGNNEPSIKLKGKTADIVLRCNNGREWSWKDVPIEPTEITKVRKDQSVARRQGFSSLQFTEIFRLDGIILDVQPVATSKVAPIKISRIVWSETGS